MYFVIALLFWPVWFLFRAAGFPAAGIVVASLVVFAGWAAAWRIEFGTWKFWRK